MALMSKWDITTDRRSYLLYFNHLNDSIQFAVTNLGTDADKKTVVGSRIVVEREWFFAAGRYKPSIEIASFVNGEKAVNTTSIPADLYSGAASFLIGAKDEGAASTLLHGGAALCFLCASALPDGVINGLYQHTRALFGL